MNKHCIKAEKKSPEIGRVIKLVAVMILTGIVYASASSYVHKVEAEDETPYGAVPLHAAGQQGRQITGTVTDTNGEPIIGANVIEKGTTNGTVTDVNGNFSLNIPGNAVLQVSYVGYVTQEVNTGNQSIISIRLQEDSQALEEVVVVGYGLQKKINLTGSVSTVDAKKLSVRPVTHGASLLQGRIAGLNITQNSGQPGSEGYGGVKKLPSQFGRII